MCVRSFLLSNRLANQMGQEVVSLQTKVEFLRWSLMSQFNLFLFFSPKSWEVEGKTVKLGMPSLLSVSQRVKPQDFNLKFDLLFYVLSPVTLVHQFSRCVCSFTLGI